ncbi:MAG TPA: hypothetical protein VF217_09220, partial [Rhodanobacteraceae bacterium]
MLRDTFVRGPGRRSAVAPRIRPLALAIVLCCAPLAAFAGETCTGMTGQSATGTDAGACGTGAIASGDGANAFGSYSDAAGFHSSAFGYNSTATGAESTAVGD